MVFRGGRGWLGYTNGTAPLSPGGPAYGTESNYLRVYMAQLRRKLEPDPAHPRHLVTEPGLGYRLCD